LLSLVRFPSYNRSASTDGAEDWRLYLNTQRRFWVTPSARCEAGRFCHCTCLSLNKSVFRQLLWRNDVIGVRKFDLLLLLLAYISLWSFIQTRNRGLGKSWRTGKQFRVL